MNFTPVLVASALALALAVPAAAQTIALDTPPAYDVQPSYRWARDFADALIEAGFEPEIFPYESIGGEAERLDQVRAGILDVSMSGYAAAASRDPAMDVLRLPYLFDDLAHFGRFVNETEFLEQLNERIAPDGMRVLAIIPLTGFLGLFNNQQEVRTPADLAAVRWRALDRGQISAIEALGGSTVPIPFSEVTTAIQTGTVNGYINPVNVPLTFGQGDLFSYYTDAELMVGARLAIASETWWEGLSDDERTAVNAAIAEASASIYTWAASMVDAEKEKLRDAGYTVTDLTDDERQAFVDATAGLRANIELDAALLEPLMAQIEATR
ncbi:TRAP transporter substrate-binding protein [Pararhodobacter zhoushanensis]|uniref:TRAP transporter substrate-binding protein n=1 Tax=Pararhodobacter zhoushanensis TaxID=2479545 RepID=A0ABT3H5D4_9RHOB|nr:TRAP transporter substrate-binding protein [Pararhodobacter zhoushanensis]MCW1935016.1 TRAP transporter substrate-binding protein [Pararhodobacter zhoushanensis]